jgi:hypothetical protein
MDPDTNLDPYPAIFVIDLEDANKIIILIFCLLSFEGTFTSFFKEKSQKEVTKSRNQDFSLLFLLDDRRIRIRIRI